VHVPTELKRTSSDDDWLDAVKQLLTYIRQVLREQLDRRYTIGLALCLDQLSVWLCDRTGVVGTETCIDIHKVLRGPLASFDKGLMHF
jgi:hypothetical protein